MAKYSGKNNRQIHFSGAWLRADASLIFDAIFSAELFSKSNYSISGNTGPHIGFLNRILIHQVIDCVIWHLFNMRPFEQDVNGRDDGAIFPSSSFVSVKWKLKANWKEKWNFFRPSKFALLTNQQGFEIEMNLTCSSLYLITCSSIASKTNELSYIMPNNDFHKFQIIQTSSQFVTLCSSGRPSSTLSILPLKFIKYYTTD